MPLWKATLTVRELWDVALPRPHQSEWDVPNPYADPRPDQRPSQELRPRRTNVFTRSQAQQYSQTGSHGPDTPAAQNLRHERQGGHLSATTHGRTTRSRSPSGLRPQDDHPLSGSGSECSEGEKDTKGKKTRWWQ